MSGAEALPLTASAPAAAYATCRRMLRRHDPTYYLAVSRLPKERRSAVYALYGFVRGADEIVDGAGSGHRPEERRAALDEWQGELERGVASGVSEHPVIAALVHAAGAHQLPVEELRPYMASMRMDCGRLRIQTREELDRYMDGSGASVGRIMAVILGAPEESERLGRLGVAFQLTNFLRDLREDYALDRIYLPAEERERHGVGEGDLAAGTASPALRELVASDVRRARELFRETTPALLTAIPRPPAGRVVATHLGVGLADVVFGSAILDRARAIGLGVALPR